MAEATRGEIPLRSFVAIRLADAVRNALAAAQARHRESGAHVGWVPAGNIHLTLAFLGSVPAEMVESIGRSLDEVGAGTAPFPLRLAGVGWFGGQRPKVIWVGAGGEGAPALAALQAEVACRVADLGFAIEEREFHAHFTLGRVRSSRHAHELTTAVEEFRDANFGDVRVQSVSLMRSQLLPQGPLYSSLHESPLTGV